METYGIQPNTTQIPHLVIREWMPRLKDVELRVLLVVADQTLGWIEDEATGRRKERDWISHSQLCQKTGRGHSAVSQAVKVLIERHGIVDAYNEAGVPLDSARARQTEGFRIYYRLNLKRPPQSLFGDTYPKSGQVKNRNTKRRLRERIQNLDMQKVETTKETVGTKELIPSYRESAPPSAERFFGEAELQAKTVDWLCRKNVPRPAAEAEVGKFVAYWTEPNKSGTRVRWQAQKFFDIRRRLATWFGRISQFSGRSAATRAVEKNAAKFSFSKKT